MMSKPWRLHEYSHCPHSFDHPQQHWIHDSSHLRLFEVPLPSPFIVLLAGEQRHKYVFVVRFFHLPMRLMADIVRELYRHCHGLSNLTILSCVQAMSQIALMLEFSSGCLLSSLAAHLLYRYKGSWEVAWELFLSRLSNPSSHLPTAASQTHASSRF